MRVGVLFSVIAFLTMWTCGCATHENDLIDRGVVSIEPQASVTSAKVFEKDGKTWVSGTLVVSPVSETHRHGLLHVEILDAKQVVTDHQDVCFFSLWQKPGYRAPGHETNPEFELPLAATPEPGSVIRFRPELNHPKCRNDHPTTIGVFSRGSH